MTTTGEGGRYGVTLQQMMGVVVVAAVALAPFSAAVRQRVPGAYLLAALFDLAVVPATASVAISLLVKDRGQRRKLRKILWAGMLAGYLALFCCLVFLRFYLYR